MWHIWTHSWWWLIISGQKQHSEYINHCQLPPWLLEDARTWWMCSLRLAEALLPTLRRPVLMAASAALSTEGSDGDKTPRPVLFCLVCCPLCFLELVTAQASSNHLALLEGKPWKAQELKSRFCEGAGKKSFCLGSSIHNPFAPLHKGFVLTQWLWEIQVTAVPTCDGA